MKASLMHADRDFDGQQPLPAQSDALTQDLELRTLLGAMAGQDKLLFEVARVALLTGTHGDVGTILHRQDVLKDCLNSPALVRQLYGIAVEAIENKREYYIGVFRNYPSGTLYDGIKALQFLTSRLKRLKSFADEHAHRFESKGFANLFTTLRREFGDDYFAAIQDHLRELAFRGGVLISAGLGGGNEGTGYILRKPHGPPRNWLQRLIDRVLRREPPGYTYRLQERDEAGARILSEMRDRGINLVANALAQSTDHILSFFGLLRTELAFYVGCLNLHDQLESKGVVVSFPRPQPRGTRRLHVDELRDASLVLTTPGHVVGNALDADGKNLVIITGANQGGKSSFLRAVGLAQLMMQCGMFVAAKSFTAEVSVGLFTHYRREEDAMMKSGKFDEELARMSAIVEQIAPDSILLFNESFASTNEREGSEIAGQIVRAVLERHIRVLFVTHLYEFAHGTWERRGDDALFLRAERLPDGTRSFKLVRGEPLQTSFGEDLYEQVFARAETC